jgi:pantoate--beta-alanine ligase
MVKTIKTVQEWKDKLKEIKDNKSIGFVPTMGALHRGHRSLIERAKSENDISIVSIFVNPTQFNDSDDLNNYPRIIERDIEMLNETETDFLFLPDEQELYPDKYRYKIIENDFSKKLCGAYRKGHFDGVLTVVMKLLNIVEADRSYFGEKDWQQYKLIKEMADTFFLKTTIIPCPIIREKNGLALSSRNSLLTEADEKKAPEFHKILASGKSLQKIKEDLKESGFKIEYIEIYEDRILGAVYLGKVRLIDNVKR